MKIEARQGEKKRKETKGKKKQNEQTSHRISFIRIEVRKIKLFCTLTKKEKGKKKNADIDIILKRVYFYKQITFSSNNLPYPVHSRNISHIMVRH